jgi:hypothetical protein
MVTKIKMMSLRMMSLRNSTYRITNTLPSAVRLGRMDGFAIVASARAAEMPRRQQIRQPLRGRQRCSARQNERQSLSD